MQRDTLILSFPDYTTQAQRLGAALGVPVHEVEIHHFPDGESMLRLPTELPARVLVCRGLDHPNEKLIELFLTSATARDQGVQHLSLIAPYLCYMRQDKAFHPGEAVSQRIIGKLLAEHFDAIITVDAHLHRVSDIQQAIPARQAINILSTEAFADFLAKTVNNPLLIGPDSESEQWVAAIANKNNFDYVVARKERLSDTRVVIKLPDYAYHGRHVVLVDDMISTGHTIAETAVLLRQQEVAHIDCLTTHALFSAQSTSLLQQSGIEHIWSSDSITHSSNIVQLAPWLARVVQ